MCLNFCADFSVKHSQFTLFLYFYDCKITLFLSYTHHKITLFLVILNLLRSFFWFCTVCIAKFLFLHEAYHIPEEKVREDETGTSEQKTEVTCNTFWNALHSTYFSWRVNWNTCQLKTQREKVWAKANLLQRLMAVWNDEAFLHPYHVIPSVEFLSASVEMRHFLESHTLME